MFGIPISTSAAISGYRLTVERITRIANHLDCFAELPMLDQSSLLKENADLLVSLRGAIFFDSKKKGVNQVLISMGIGKTEKVVVFKLRDGFKNERKKKELIKFFIKIGWVFHKKREKNIALKDFNSPEMHFKASLFSRPLPARQRLL